MTIATAITLRALRAATDLAWIHIHGTYRAPIPGTDTTVHLSPACDVLWLSDGPDVCYDLDDDDRAHLGASVARVLAEWAADITRDASERLELAARLRIAAEGRAAEVADGR